MLTNDFSLRACCRRSMASHTAGCCDAGDEAWSCCEGGRSSGSNSCGSLGRLHDSCGVSWTSFSTTWDFSWVKKTGDFRPFPRNSVQESSTNPKHHITQQPDIYIYIVLFVSLACFFLPLRKRIYKKKHHPQLS